MPWFLLLLALGEIKSPPVKDAPLNRLVRIEVSTTTKETQLIPPPGEGVKFDAFQEFSAVPGKLFYRVQCYEPGVYRFIFVGATGDGKVEYSTTDLTAGIPPTPPPTPDPVDPPTPGPGPGPTPTPAPIPLEGFRALMVYDAATLARLPASQQAIFYSPEVRGLLNSLCVPGPKNREWRVLPSETNMDADAEHWRNAMKRERKSLPWLILSNGKTGYEGPLPSTVEETVGLIKKIAGGK